jgi:hypothetical protein
MPLRRSIFLNLLTALALTAICMIPFTQPAQAQIQPHPNHESNDNCIKCHEDLYFLHDTGNWYCIKESPMTCTECHGGNASAITSEEAHTGRAAHPVINNDITKCQECHAEECDERMDIFNQVAGINAVLVAVPYTPVPRAEPSMFPPGREQETNLWINLREILPILLVAGAAVMVHFVHRIRHQMKRRS